MSLLRRLGALLRVRTDEVEAVLRHDERRARDTVTRRQFMGASAALAAAPFVPRCWVEVPALASLTIRERVHQPFWDELIRTAGLTPELVWERHLPELEQHLFDQFPA